METGTLPLPCLQTFLEWYHKLGATTILVLVCLVKESDPRLSTSNPQSPVEVQQLMLIADRERTQGAQKPVLSKCS